MSLTPTCLRPQRRQGPRWPILAFLCLALMAAGAPAQARNESGAVRDLQTSYHAPSDSYFRLVQDFQTTKRGVTWGEARRLARQMSYQGRTGRLAVIRDPELFRWMLSALPLSTVSWGGKTWIGLRYWCAARQLVWIDMKPHPREALSPWMVPWNMSGDACATGATPYMGVFHLGPQGRWQAVAAGKRYPHYIVEFPPKERTPGDDQSAAAPSDGG